MVRDALTVRYRELYGTTRGDPESVVEADVGRGVHIFLWGLPPDRRLPLRAYHAGITFKNGVPINYIEGISLFEWMEVGFNTFYAFRDGETAWIYSKVLHLLHQLTDVTCFSVYPYQLGDQNEEAIKSGAFWFYRKLGFRPGRPELLAMTQREEAKIASKPAISDIGSHSAQTGHGACVLRVWRRTARAVGHVFRAKHRAICTATRWQRNSMAIPTRCGAPQALDSLRYCEVDTGTWSAIDQSAFEDFAVVLSLVPELKRWTGNQKQALTQIILAKVSRR